MPIDSTVATQLEGVKVLGSDGRKLGKVDAVYYDNRTYRPEWAAVVTGFFDKEVSLVPLATAVFDGAVLTVPYDKATIECAPHQDPDRELAPADEADLYRYYDLDGGGPDAGTAPGTGPAADDAVTRSEERMRVGTERSAVGTARLRKRVVTEQERASVPVTREELRVEREPVTDANAGRALDGPAISEEEHEVTLHEERPVVDKEVRPVERVRLGTQQVTHDEQVTGDVRREEIEIDDGRGRHD